MRLIKLLVFVPLLGSISIGCSTTKGDSHDEALDPVCVFNRDLGCVRVRVEATTPRLTHHGETYYFCSSACRDAFAREPEKYLRREGAR